MKNALFKNFAFILAFALIFTSAFFPSEIFAEESLTAQDAVNDAVVWYYSSVYMYSHGERLEIPAEDLTFIFKDNTIYAEYAYFAETFGAKYAYDGNNGLLSFEKNGIKVAVKLFDAYADIEENGAFMHNDCVYVPIGYIAKELGFNVFDNKRILYVSEKYDLNDEKFSYLRSEIEDLVYDTVVLYDFDQNPKFGTLSKWSGAKNVDDEFYKSWGVTDEDKHSGEKSLKLTAFPKDCAGYAGFSFPKVRLDKSKMYVVTFYVKATDDFKNNFPRLCMMGYSESGAWLSLEVFKDLAKGDYGTEWTRYDYVLDPSALNASVEYVDIVVAMAGNGQSGATSGALYFDDISLKSAQPRNDSAEKSPQIMSNKKMNWYKIGETVTMTPTQKLDTNVYKTATMTVKNSYGEPVYEKTVSAKSFNGGISYVPDDIGYYELSFTRTDIYGQTTTYNEFYNYLNPKTSKYVRMDIPGQGIIVVPGDTKPMDERSPRWSASLYTNRYPAKNGEQISHPKGHQQDAIELADLVGFSKIRFHAFTPHSFNSNMDTVSNHERGDFYFDEYDESMREAAQYGFTIITNFYGTPLYAAPNSPKGAFDPKTGAYGKQYYAYMPDNIKAYEAYMKKCVDQWDDICDYWEVWNEPHVYGGSVFWAGTTPDFIKLLKTSYEYIKSKGENEQVILGGLGARRYTSFVNELVKYGGWQYFDLLAMHGWDLDPWTYNNIAKSYGEEPKRICSTECHFTLKTPGSEFAYNTEKEETFRFLVSSLKDIKYGSEFTTHFSLPGSQADDELIRYMTDNKISAEYAYANGFYRRYPKYPQQFPRFLAAASHTFFEHAGKQYDYADEYLFGDQNVVRMNTNGKEQLVVWLDGGSKAEAEILSSKVASLLDSDYEIYDWEGRKLEVSDLTSFTLRPETMYFIYGANSEKLDALPSGKGDGDGKGDVLYNLTERAAELAKSDLNAVSAITGTGALFDKTSGALADGIVYVTTDWQTVSDTDGASADGKSAKFSVSAGDDGMYFVFETEGISDAPIVSKTDDIDKNNILKFAFDTGGARQAKDTVVYSLGILNGECVLVKSSEAFIGGDVIADYTKEGGIVNSAVVKTEEKDGKKYYKIFLPDGEVYPYQRDSAKVFSFGASINAQNGAHLIWSDVLKGETKGSGIGKVYFNRDAFFADGNYIAPEAQISAKPLFDKNNFAYADGINWIDSLEWVACADGKEQGDFSARFVSSVVEGDGLYFIWEVNDTTDNALAKTAGGLYSVDSVQFAIDTTSEKNNALRAEYQFGRILSNPDNSVLFKENVPAVAGKDVPENFTATRDVVKNCIHKISRTGDKTTYMLFMPFDEVYPYSPEQGSLKFSMLINNNDTNERVGYLEWGSGIGKTKNTAHYGKLIIEK